MNQETLAYVEGELASEKLIQQVINEGVTETIGKAVERLDLLTGRMYNVEGLLAKQKEELEGKLVRSGQLPSEGRNEKKFKVLGFPDGLSQKELLAYGTDILTNTDIRGKAVAYPGDTKVTLFLNSEADGPLLREKWNSDPPTVPDAAGSVCQLRLRGDRSPDEIRKAQCLGVVFPLMQTLLSGSRGKLFEDEDEQKAYTIITVANWWSKAEPKFIWSADAELWWSQQQRDEATSTATKEWNALRERMSL